MKSKLQKNQEIIDAIEAAADGLITMPDEALIASLRNYVDASDFIGVKRNPQKLVDSLKRKYVCVSKLAEKTRNAETKEDLLLCIIGNFIYSNGTPPPNVMERFCNQYLLIP